MLKLCPGTVTWSWALWEYWVSYPPQGLTFFPSSSSPSFSPFSPSSAASSCLYRNSSKGWISPRDTRTNASQLNSVDVNGGGGVGRLLCSLCSLLQMGQGWVIVLDVMCLIGWYCDWQPIVSPSFLAGWIFSKLRVLRQPQFEKQTRIPLPKRFHHFRFLDSSAVSGTDSAFPF